MRLVYHLEGLDCANCAAKIETAAGKLENVRAAVVDFSSSRIILDIEGTDRERVKLALQETVSAVEPHVIVAEQRTKLAKPQLLTVQSLSFALGLLTFLAALVVPWGGAKRSLYLAAYVLAGSEIIVAAYRNLRQGQVFDENFLMTIATAGALAIGEFPEAASVMIFYRTGEFLQHLAVDRSRRSIAALAAVKPETAHRKEGDTTREVPVEKLLVGDQVVVRPGERIPVDGLVLEGSSAVDTSALTGESIPREVSPGLEVLAGSINLRGLLTLKATKLAKDSAVSRILALVEDATAKKAPTEEFITKFARYYTPAVVLIAGLLAAIPPLFFGGLFSDWFYRALVFLVISCPCALVISIPLGFFAGIGRASRQGVLVKGSNYLQALQEAETIVFDKTGTLTSGQFSVQQVLAAAPFSADEVLEMAAHAESFSTHPLARSIVRAYQGKLDPGSVNQLEELSGFGVKANLRGREVLVGSLQLLEQEGVEPQEAQSELGVQVAVDRRYAGTIILEDTAKTNSRRAVQELNALGLEVVMLTGDGAAAAERMGRELGVSRVSSELLPHEKVEELEKIMAGHKGKVVFVGDGINDAPALARAHVGIAMGALGSQAAVETADVVIMNDDPYSIVQAVHTAKRTNTIVWQNITLAFAVKLLVLFLGSLGLATLWEAVFADVGVTLLAVLNSLRIVAAAGQKGKLACEIYDNNWKGSEGNAA